MGFTTPTEGMVTGMGGRAGVTPEEKSRSPGFTPPDGQQGPGPQMHPGLEERPAPCAKAHL